MKNVGLWLIAVFAMRKMNPIGINTLFIYSYRSCFLGGVINGDVVNIDCCFCVNKSAAMTKSVIFVGGMWCAFLPAWGEVALRGLNLGN